VKTETGVSENGNLALLDVQTRETSVPGGKQRKHSGLHSPLIPSTNLLAGRVSYDFQ